MPAKEEDGRVPWLQNFLTHTPAVNAPQQESRLRGRVRQRDALPRTGAAHGAAAAEVLQPGALARHELLEEGLELDLRSEWSYSNLPPI